MPKLTVEGVGQYEVPLGKRLVLALEQDVAIDQLHACGGQARCTTCRVEFLDGEPDRMTVAERDGGAGLVGHPAELSDRLQSRYDGSCNKPFRGQWAKRRGARAGCGDRAAPRVDRQVSI